MEAKVVAMKLQWNTFALARPTDTIGKLFGNENNIEFSKNSCAMK
jgi:hypothetical protein